ncbi:pyrrolidone-carboxylate peptidase [Deinococcus piscis]|uniref:Pyrrolidone-carboxylate peptidase n=1 Tax=Deinococcus piscis TaxID=394230 RepID=A0ABQ3K6Q6_9DEIO|nr:pyroglutamyl-peptidase I [Deinococcus piscis]GHG05471.1 pyrrolidone-carboxylate peptidase [Deinococcus piscis]
MKILVTGFDPFNQQDENPAGLIAQSLPDQIGGVAVVGREIPTQYRAATQAILAAIREVGATHVLCLGMDGSRPGLCPETRGYNWADVSIADNAGVKLTRQLLEPDGPLAWHTTLSTPQALAAAALAYGVPAEVSQDPGSFVCNNVTYELGYLLAQSSDLQHVKYGFVHVPKLPGQRAPYTLPLDTMRRGVVAMLEHIVAEGAEGERGALPEQARRPHA